MVLALTVILTCMPAAPKSQTFAGPAGVKLVQTLRNREVTLELFGGDGKSQWKHADRVGLFEAVFSDDGAWVATPRTTHASKVVVFGSSGAIATYEALSLVTEEEKQNMSHTSCGLAWFGGLKFEGSTLVVSVKQAFERPPIYAPDPTPPLELLIDCATKKMTRRTPAAAAESIDSLIAGWKAEPGRRAELLKKLVRKSELAENRKSESLRTFARAELPGAIEPEVQAGLLGLLRATATDDDRLWVAERALEAKWPVGGCLGVLAPLKGSPAAVAYAKAVVKQRLGGNNDRAEALRRAIDSRPPDALELVAGALDDPDPYVREAAGFAMRNLPRDDATFAFLAERVMKLPAARGGLVELFLKLPLDDKAARFESGCEAWRTAWPGCDAWSGAVADVRGDAALARTRYERAAKAMGAMMEQRPSAMMDRDDLYRVHVRLARLALAEKRTGDAKEIAKVLAEAKWAENGRSDCGSGLPRSLDKKCAWGDVLRELGEKGR